MKIRILLLLQILYLLFSCNGNNNLLEKALTFSGPNRNELDKVLRHYQNDDLKYKAAVFLIENMPTKYTIIGNELDSIRLVLASADNRGVVAEVLRNRWKGIMPNGEKVYDCRVITANYLINNIERSFDLWKSKEWNTSLSFIDFCELILPYRIGNEPLEEWWVPYKEKYGKILDSLYQGSDVIEAVKHMNLYLRKDGFRNCSDFNIPNLGALHLLKNRIGKCGDSCDFYLYVMRSVGIPVATDFYYYSPETRTGHTWNTVRDSKGIHHSFSFLDCDPTPGKIYTDWRKIGKVGRQYFGYPPARDVSNEYFKDTLVISIPKVMTRNEVYLGVFHANSWKVIDHAIIENGKARFNNVESDIIYMLLSLEENHLKELGYPFYFDGNSVYPYRPDIEHTEKIILYRKYPLYHWMKEFSGYMVNGRFEASNDPSFRACELLYQIVDTPTIDYNKIDLSTPVKARYVRYLGASDRRLEMAELRFMNHDTIISPVKLTGSEYFDNSVSPEKIIDGDPLTCYMAKAEGGQIVFDLGCSKQINSLVYMPRNGDNCIRIGDIYELFYHNGENGWTSLGGKRMATEPQLSYNNAPKGALFYLHNWTRGFEEQPFYIKKGKQKFVTNLETKPKGYLR